MIPDPCYGQVYEWRLNTLSVVPGTGSATVSWSNAGNSSVASYRVAAVPQDLVLGSQPALRWVTVPPGTGCDPVTTTLTGLRSGGRYAFWLDAVLTSAPREVMIGRSDGITVL